MFHKFDLACILSQQLPHGKISRKDLTALHGLQLGPRSFLPRKLPPTAAFKVHLGGGFEQFFIFTPYLGKWFPFWRAYFSDGLKPPTRKCFVYIFLFFLIPFRTGQGIQGLDGLPLKAMVVGRKTNPASKEGPKGNFSGGELLNFGGGRFSWCFLKCMNFLDHFHGCLLSTQEPLHKGRAKSESLVVPLATEEHHSFVSTVMLDRWFFVLFGVGWGGDQDGSFGFFVCMSKMTLFHQDRNYHFNS